MGIRIESQLNLAHAELMDKLQIEQKARIDKARAREMESVLYQIKNLNTNTNNPIDKALFQQAGTIINESLSALNARRKGRSKLTAQQLFHRTHSTHTGAGGDDIFEEELAAVLASIESLATGTTVDFTSKLTGRQAANIKLEQEVDKTVEKVLTQYNKRLTKTISSTGTREGQKKHTVNTRAASGKVDVTGISNMTVTADLNPAWERLFQLFSNCTFSVKNYSSKATTSLNIHLGSTNIYKALYGALSQSGRNEKEINYIIMAGLRSYMASKNHTVATHFYHLRFIYELTGVGLHDREGPISGVDFLIYNDPSSDAIYVRSTADLILQELNRKRTASLLSGISLTKSMFKEDQKF